MMGTPLPLVAYRMATRFAAPLAGLHLRRRVGRGKEDASRLTERFGITDVARPEGALIWLHAASVGESLSALPLIDGIRDVFPDAHFLLTTGTVTSAELLSRRVPSLLHQFVPVDTPQAVERFLNHWRPDFAIWMESELWPNLVLETARRGVPMALVNARLSQKSASGWRWAPKTIAALLGAFEVRLAQTEAIRERLLQLGASKTATPVTGDLKASRAPETVDERMLEPLRASIGSRPVWLAASTHPGDETSVLAGHNALAVGVSDLLTIIAPRHPERGPHIEAAARDAGLRAVRRAAGAMPEGDIYIADTLGEMALWYALAPVALIGGGWGGEGGHNPLEAAERGAAILSGPVVHNFEESYARLCKAGAALLVERGALNAQLREMFDPCSLQKHPASVTAIEPGFPRTASVGISEVTEKMRVASFAEGKPDPMPLRKTIAALDPLLREALR